MTIALVTSPKGVKAIQGFEGLRLEAYVDAVGATTIGYGHTGTEHAFIGNTITKKKAIELLRLDLRDSEKAVNSLVKVELTQDQFDALSSLVFNIGTGNFRKSTLLKKLNQGDYLGAADEFLKWRKGGGKVLPGLVTRRAKERAMFLEGTEIQETEDEFESNIEADAPEKPSVASSKPIQSLAATGVAGTLAGAAEMAAPLAEYSDYLKILWIILVLAGIGYFIWKREEE